MGEEAEDLQDHKANITKYFISIKKDINQHQNTSLTINEKKFHMNFGKEFR